MNERVDHDAGATAHRVILHVDMDAFYVSVELLRRPELRGLPVVVGGTGPRGVVAAASYEARRYGLRSAMPSVTARRMCPNAVFLPGDHAHYAEVSGRVFDVFRSFSPLVEGLSLDEAFIDVSGARRLFGPGATVAQAVRDRVLDDVGLTCSVGVAPNKFLAKLASEAAKPSAGPHGVRAGAGVVEVLPGEELAFLHPLPVQALWGVGPATLERLRRLGVRTVADLAMLDEAALIASVGKAHGRHLYALAWARDDRPVEPDRELKSIGHEETFAADKYTHDELAVELVRLADGVASRLRAHGGRARTVQVKVRFAGFDTITRSVTPPTPMITAQALLTAARALLAEIDPTPGVRLLGISVSNFVDDTEQLTLDSLFGDSLFGEQAAGGPIDDGSHDRRAGDDEWRMAETTVDEIRRRFGGTSIAPASSISQGKVRVVRSGQQQWGPDHQPG